MPNKELARWDPFKTIWPWDPFEEIREMQHEMDRLFGRFGMGRDIAKKEATFGTWVPSVESYLKDKELVFKCELPGVDPKEVEVTVDENTHQLIVKGEKKTEKDTKEENYIYREMAYGSFERRFTLPEGVKTGEVKAKFTNGVLEISVPAPEIPKAKKIEIQATPTMIEGEADVKKKAA
jgi:HSP20 family protein